MVEDTSSLTMTVGGQTLTRAGVSSEALETVAGSDGEGLALHPGQTLAGFKIERPLGSGGMGQVFAARRIADPGAELVALKYLERTSASLLYRFKQEFRALAGVSHDNLVSLHELVVDPEHGTFFTMELIDGVPFDEYVRDQTPAGELPNLARLRRALRQLVAGVRHLHRIDCIHRDLKPSNVLVTAEGRVVILDFGLVQDHSGEIVDDPKQQILGTPAYMSPEQAGLEQAGPASDWYSVGVMLFECLTGKRPFRGTVTHLLFAKREFEPPEVATIVPQAPVELTRLCQRLLARDPRARPSATEIAAVLGGVDLDREGGLGEAGVGGPGAKRAPFIGRRAELAELEAAYQALRRGPTTPAITIHVRGQSGHGKSTLVREFIASVRERDEVVVFKGRCLDRESVPYKGLDAVVDALSIYLRSLASETLAELLPSYPAALVRLFPVLDELWSATQLRALGVSASALEGLDAHELRQRAFAALRELLTKLANRRPLIVCIDDFQWGNVDSARLLTELLRPPDAPAMLVVISYRDEVVGNEALAALTCADALAGRDVRELALGPLSRAEARALALALLGERCDPALADAYADGAEGSPFYVGQLVHGGAVADGSPGQLDQLVARRILALDPASRRLLELVAVAGGPIASEVAFAAAELDDPERLVPALRAAELLRVELSDGPEALGLTLETTHDRIREVTVGELGPEQLRATHLRLALALEGHASDPQALAEHLAEHFERGGDRVRAAAYSQGAAEQAARSLAFARAVALYRKTLELLGEDADPGRIAGLQRALAEQLIHVGRGHEAAQLLLCAAAWYEAPAQAERALARELRRQAADQLIKTGHVEAGLAELDRLLRSVGLKLPSGKAAAVSALVWEQARLRLRGLGFEQRPAAEAPPELLDQIDTCFAVVNGLSTQETLLSALFHFRNLRLSLTAGEPVRVARALAYQCVIDVAGGDWRRVEDQLGTARRLAAEVGDPQLRGFIDLCDASVQWFERRFLQSSVRHTAVIEQLEGVAGATWDRRTAQLHHMWTLLSQGRLREFWDRAKGSSERARERGDMQEMVEVSSFSAIALVLAGEVDEARRLLSAAQADWNPGRYLFGDVWACFAWVAILLHEGEPEQAVALSKETLAQMKRTFLDQSATARRNAQEHLARALAGVAILRDDPHDVRAAAKLSAQLRAEGNEVLSANMDLIDAGLASLRGDREAAMAHWSTAASSFEAHGICGQVAAVHARQAAVLGDSEEGRALAAQAQAYFEREGIVDIEGFCRVLAPARIEALRGGSYTPEP
jgi:eukaryotic-like serine/threonine-protein kinase